ncbi:hypothetical protein HID58_073774 [Brassica napus]|uniref:Uncharacterized protein n=1 Tax=Brassica napus TaxID=3708 RepID=A0ABQ7YF08_BRANA|nr:hypothetical protein HID58_073774 [Brassica napus]
MLGKLARPCVGNPKDFKTTNNFVSRHEGESKTRGMNRKSRGNGGEAPGEVTAAKIQVIKEVRAFTSLGLKE